MSDDAQPAAMPGGEMDLKSEAFEIDQRRAVDLSSATEALLGGLPESNRRSPSQVAQAEGAKADRRRARSAFLEEHCERIYADLTDDFRLHLRIDELAGLAGDTFPFLMPTSEQMGVEDARDPLSKEGIDLDQGVFFHHVLKNRRCGTHLLASMLRPLEESRRLLPAFEESGVLQLDTVRVDRRDGTIHLTIQNESCLNAEDNQLIADMDIAVDLCLLESSTSVVVVRGGVMTHPKYAGTRVFSAGMNLKELEAGRISFVRFLLQRELSYLHKIRRGVLVNDCSGSIAVRACQKCWLGVVDSFAIGGGLQLLLLMDHVVASRDAYFSLPASNEGIIPGVANLRLPLVAGSRQARRMILMGERIAASSTDAECICDQAVEEEELEATIDQAVQCLSSRAALSNRMMFSVSEEPLDSFRNYMAEFAYLQAERLVSRDVSDSAEAWRQSLLAD